jgi:DNA-binding response OmpR family regulator
MRLLVVEDEAAVRHVVDRLLTAHGHHVVVAPTVIEAMALLLDFPEAPDVGLLDLVLPGMGGVAYAKHLVRQFPMIRLVFMTGWFEGPQMAEAEALGTLLLKPFTPHTLLAAVEITP